MSDKTKPVLSARVDQKLIDRIDALVERTEVSRAEVIERALAVGLKEQEQFLAGFEGTFTGPLLSLLFNEKFLNVVYALTGDEIDPNQLKAVKALRKKVKDGKSRPRLATE